MKTLLVIGLGLVAIVAIVVMVIFEIIELAFGAVFFLLAVIAMIWLYKKVKRKLD